MQRHRIPALRRSRGDVYKRQVGDEVFLKLHGYGWLFGTIIAFGHDTMLVAGHDLDKSKRVAYRWITDVRDTAPDGETWNKVGDVEQAAKENQ